jgi:hypothetical protein
LLQKRQKKKKKNHICHRFACNNTDQFFIFIFYFLFLLYLQLNNLATDVSQRSMDFAHPSSLNDVRPSNPHMPAINQHAYVSTKPHPYPASSQQVFDASQFDQVDVPTSLAGPENDTDSEQIDDELLVEGSHIVVFTKPADAIAARQYAQLPFTSCVDMGSRVMSRDEVRLQGRFITADEVVAQHVAYIPRNPQQLENVDTLIPVAVGSMIVRKRTRNLPTNLKMYITESERRQDLVESGEHGSATRFRINTLAGSAFSLTAGGIPLTNSKAWTQSPFNQPNQQSRARQVTPVPSVSDEIDTADETQSKIRARGPYFCHKCGQSMKGHSKEGCFPSKVSYFRLKMNF